MHCCTASALVAPRAACALTHEPHTGRPSTVAIWTSPVGLAIIGAGGPDRAGGDAGDPLHAATSTTSQRICLIALDEGKASHLLADRDHRDAYHHDQQRRDVVAPREVVERLLEEEQTSGDECDGEDFEEVATHDHLIDGG